MARLSEFMPAVIQHLAGYCELAKASADEWRRETLRRAAYAIAGFTCAGTALLYACGWALMAAWDSPARNWVGAGTLCSLAVASWAMFSIASRRSIEMPQTALLLMELQQDRQLLLELQTRNVA